MLKLAMSLSARLLLRSWNSSGMYFRLLWLRIRESLRQTSQNRISPLAPVLQAQVAQVEKGEHLVLLRDGVVVHLGEILHGDVVPGVGQLLEDLGLVAREGPRVLGVRGVDEADDVHHHHLVIGHDGPARLAEQIRHGHLLLGADVLGGVDHVGGVLGDGVVHGAAEGGLAAVVVHAQAAAHVQVADGHAHLTELGVDAGGLLHGRLHLRMSVIWLPMWKCSSMTQSSRSRFSRVSMASRISWVVRPNLAWSPALVSHLPRTHGH
jgi:hypothetical protein